MAISDQADVVRSPQQAPPPQAAPAPATVGSPPSQDAAVGLQRALGNEGVQRANGDWGGGRAQAVWDAMNADGDWSRDGGPWYQLNGHNPAGLLEVLRRLGPEGRKRLADQQVDGRRYDKPRLD